MNTSYPPGPAGAGGVSVGPQEAGSAEALAGKGIECLRAPNPGPYTLTGTNTWIIGRDPAWIVDPGPLLDAHLERLFAAVQQRGGLGGIALTHSHGDHSDAVGALRERYPAPLAAGRGEVDLQMIDGEHFGPFELVATPGHASDHFALIAAGACFTGDAVLGTGSVFISPHPGAMSGYLQALERLGRRDDLDVLCPGHGPAVWEPQARLAEYRDHRMERERMLLEALAQGRRSTQELLDHVWPEAPPQLRLAATATLAAHLDKLEEDGVLPPGVERPALEGVPW
jgi:glyoxylase-like metal-dependent hydrolase (beta-lactamase superfamily II)